MSAGFSRETYDAVVSLKATGMRNSLIVRHTGLSASTVYRCVRAAGYARERPGFPPAASCWCGRPVAETWCVTRLCTFHFRVRNAANQRRLYWSKRGVGPLLLEVLRDGPGTAAELCVEIDRSRNTTRSVLCCLEERGDVKRDVLPDGTVVWALRAS